MNNIWESKIFALGMLLFFGTKILANLPYLSRFSGSSLDEFLSGLGTGLIIVGLLTCGLGKNLKNFKENLFLKLK